MTQVLNTIKEYSLDTFPFFIQQFNYLKTSTSALDIERASYLFFIFLLLFILASSSIFEVDAETGAVRVTSGATYDGQYTTLMIIAVDDSATNQHTGTGYMSICLGTLCCQSSAGLQTPIYTVVFALQIAIIFSVWN